MNNLLCFLLLQIGQQSLNSIFSSGQFFSFGQFFRYDVTINSLPATMHSFTVQLSELFHMSPARYFVSPMSVQNVAKHSPQQRFGSVL